MPAVFKQYNARGTDVSTGGLYSLVALWNSVKKLDGTVNVEACYRKSLEGVAEVEMARQVAWVLLLLVRNSLGTFFFLVVSRGRENKLLLMSWACTEEPVRPCFSGKLCWCGGHA